MIWKWGSKGCFTVKLFYAVLRGSTDHSFPLKAVQGGSTPQKLAFFVWNATWGKIWNGFLHFLVWLVWIERNDRTFNGLEKHVGQVKGRLYKTVFEWAVIFVQDTPTSFGDFSSYLSASNLLQLFNDGLVSALSGCFS